MHDITILQGPVTLPAGALLKLSPDQARRRRHLLTPAGQAGVFRSVDRVQFKTGETLATDADIPKSLNDRVKVAGGKPKPARRGKPKTAAQDDTKDDEGLLGE